MSTLPESERSGIASICVLAALADGVKDDREREQIRSIVEAFAPETGGRVAPDLYQRIVLGQVTVEQAAGSITSPQARTLAYEMALGVCEADGGLNESERSFLSRLKGALAVNPAEASQAESRADELVHIPLDGPAPIEAVTPAAAAAAVAAAPAAVAAPVLSDADAKRKAEIDGSILNYSILNAALELLPQTLSTAAIIPLQMRMVYGIGKRYGFELDRGHIKDFLATIGAGAASQVVEGYARKLFGKFVRKTIGGTIGGIVAGATGPAITFASTYAIGQVAHAYYANGRRLPTEKLKELFTSKTREAGTLYEKYKDQIVGQSQKIDPTKVLSLLKN